MCPDPLAQLPLLTFSPGDVVIAEGAPEPGLFFLVSGEVEIRRQEQLLSRLDTPGAPLGEMSWLLQRPATASVIATSPCTFRHAADPAALCSAHPEIALTISRVLAQRLDSLSRYLVAIKEEFKDRTDHLGMLDQILATLLHRQPRAVPRREAGH